MDPFRDLIACLGDTVTSYDVDRPSDPEGEWWIDLSLGDFSTSVAWRSRLGFGIYRSTDDAYGAGPDETYKESKLAAKRLKQLAGRSRAGDLALRLNEVRSLLDQPQTAIAEKLDKEPSGLSRLERQNEAHLGAIRAYIEALGGEVQLTVRFSDFHASIDLPAVKPRRSKPQRKPASPLKSAS